MVMTVSLPTDSEDLRHALRDKKRDSATCGYESGEWPRKRVSRFSRFETHHRNERRVAWLTYFAVNG
jgi:hypothetical protein